MHILGIDPALSDTSRTSLVVEAFAADDGTDPDAPPVSTLLSADELSAAAGPRCAVVLDRGELLVTSADPAAIARWLHGELPEVAFAPTRGDL